MFKLNLESSKFLKNPDVLNRRLNKGRDVSNFMIRASYAAIFSAFLINLIVLYIPLINFLDNSLGHGISLFMSRTDPQRVTFYCTEVVYLFIFYPMAILTISTKRSLLACNVLLNWINVGMLLALLSMPYTR
ncbi:hypothetical protein BEWA_019190 [Theileria equi strain WA]|uniref:Uncharacterized protein n=1 Tax=Theileria equi strain WA TaxID=1537102 RepID=L0AW00_THEEQ|nr:hypothetical protein BEWA_019190 [Theileria equi strain WA]AFZ79074.1 hypothetical protein BEWA_019190 [Theileria equi strain WA]|eukprot:XP_004828740.1 hypothetical protein BEWA_019190 [Theileria equi strain WA]